MGSWGHCASGLSAAITATGQHCSGVSAHDFLWAAWHLAPRAPQCESRVPLSSHCAISRVDREMVLSEAEEHSFPSCTWWMASLCHWVQHCSSNHLKTSQLMCPLLSQKQQDRTPAVQTTCRLSLSPLPPAAPGRCPPAQEVKASGTLVPAWPWQNWLMAPIAFPSRQPDGSNESAASGLVKRLSSTLILLTGTTAWSRNCRVSHVNSRFLLQIILMGPLFE